MLTFKEQVSRKDQDVVIKTIADWPEVQWGGRLCPESENVALALMCCIHLNDDHLIDQTIEKIKSQFPLDFSAVHKPADRFLTQY